ncbi:hypothetical protein DPMN_093887 [Dreissena polymorpha]|uniref:Uncharacterized protein n=1 Tax=Dreissena polymorpha TaxID=45954 RepID=A0A9D4L4E2_DREPO|nr:hypothetical protein DPMN_093887 [Dreissena polymorpha]
MSDKKTDWVYDELLCFLGSAFFQIPVNGFIDVKSESKHGISLWEKGSKYNVTNSGTP